MAYKLVLVLTLHCLVQVLYSKEHLVQTNCRSHSNSCRTFNDYANDADTYFTSDSSFNFMKGTHHLNATLFISNVVNLSFVGDVSDIILSNGCSIIWTNSCKLFWTSLNLIFNETNEISNNSAIYLEKFEAVTFSNVSFFKFYRDPNSFSRAIQAVSSSIVFNSCKFENGYHSKGGSLFIGDSIVTFGGHNVFVNNTARNTAGAMYGLRSQIQLNGKNAFMSNRAGIGGGLKCDGAAIHVELCSLFLTGYFEFNNNHVVENTVWQFGSFWSFSHGGTIAASHSTLTMQGVLYFINNSNSNGGAILLHTTECSFSGHVEFKGNVAFVKGGAISATNSSLIIKNTEYINSERSSISAYSKSVILFFNNSAKKWGGAVVLHASSMTLTGSVIFLANKAEKNGGGISIFYSSESRKCHPNFITFQGPLDLLFRSNAARGLGGALYVDDANSDHTTQWGRYCFFTVNGSIIDIKLNFTGNKASQGTGIYGGSIQYCEVEIRNQRQRGYKILQYITKSSTAIQNVYANNIPYKISLCNGATSDIRVQRGQVFNISVTVLGEFDVPVNQSVAFTTVSYNLRRSSEVVGQRYNFLNEKGCRNLGFSVLSSHQTEVIVFHLPQCFKSFNSSSTLRVHLDDCPPGFELIINACKCQENIFEVTGIKDLCNSSTGLIKCPQHDWMKPIFDENLTYQGFMWSPNCPTHLCRNDQNNWLDFSSDNADFLCLENRTAMLCGACLQNYSLTLSSLKCSKCSSNNYLSLLLVFALAGVALIASLLLLQMTVADGTFNGLIFYANIVNIIKNIIFSQDKLSPNPTIFLSWLNLDFGIQTCFYAGLSYYSYTWLQFVFPFYLWFLVGLIILACKYSSRAMKLFGSNPVAVLATVVLMSYSKLLHTSQQILSYVTVYYSDGTQEKRWKIDPNLLYFQGKHIPLVLVGILTVLIFLVPYLVLISFAHNLQKYTNKRGLKWLIKIKPILDAYYAPFRESTRYWVGLMLFIRTCLSITLSTLTNTENTTILVIVSSVLTGVALIPWLHHKIIYEKNFVNVLEGSFISNVIVLSIISYYIITQEYKNYQLVLSYSSIGIAFVEFLAIFAFHVWHRMNLKRLYMKHCKSCRSASAESSNQCAAKAMEDKPGGSASTTMVFDIREPLLDTSTDL